MHKLYITLKNENAGLLASASTWCLFLSVSLYTKYVSFSQCAHMDIKLQCLLHLQTGSFNFTAVMYLESSQQFLIAKFLQEPSGFHKGICYTNFFFTIIPLNNYDNITNNMITCTFRGNCHEQNTRITFE